MKKLLPGERGLNYILFIVCAIFFIESLKLYQKDPTPYSYGAIPLLLSFLCMVCCAWTFVGNQKAEKPKYASVREQLNAVRLHVAPKDIVVIFVFFIAYCFGLTILRFVVCTPLFLWACMSYLSGGKYLKNILYSGLTTAFILVIFRFVFKVILP